MEIRAWRKLPGRNRWRFVVALPERDVQFWAIVEPHPLRNGKWRFLSYLDSLRAAAVGLEGPYEYRVWETREVAQREAETYIRHTMRWLFNVDVPGTGESRC